MTRLAFALAAVPLFAACGSSSSDNSTPPVALPDCATYCTAVTAACTGTANVQYTDATQCALWCGTAYGWASGAAGDTSGDTIGCRTYHAGVAATSAASATIHCPHAGPTGGNTCGGWLDVYCDLAVRNCTGANQIYASVAACKADAGVTGLALTGAVNATGGNNVQCRIWHLGKAGETAAAPATHCPHAKIPSVNAAGAAGPCI
jgi:hypothetical protein